MKRIIVLIASCLIGSSIAADVKHVVQLYNDMEANYLIVSHGDRSDVYGDLYQNIPVGNYAKVHFTSHFSLLPAANTSAQHLCRPTFARGANGAPQLVFSPCGSFSANRFQTTYRDSVSLFALLKLGYGQVYEDTHVSIKRIQ